MSDDLADRLRIAREGTIDRLRGEIRDLRASIKVKEDEIDRIEKTFRGER